MSKAKTSAVEPLPDIPPPDTKPTPDAELVGSPTLGRYVKAFHAVRAGLAPEGKNSHLGNEHLTLTQVVLAVREGLEDHGLAFYFTVEDGYMRLHLVSDGGSIIAVQIPFVPSKERDMQAVGSAITYARRYLLCMAFGIVADKDDDGNASSGRRRGGAKEGKEPMTLAQFTQMLGKTGRSGMSQARKWLEDNKSLSNIADYTTAFNKRANELRGEGAK